MCGNGEEMKEKVVVFRELQRTIKDTRELSKQAMEGHVRTAFTVYSVNKGARLTGYRWYCEPLYACASPMGSSHPARKKKKARKARSSSRQKMSGVSEVRLCHGPRVQSVSMVCISGRCRGPWSADDVDVFVV
jgi:hypothetical protein